MREGEESREKGLGRDRKEEQRRGGRGEGREKRDEGGRKGRRGEGKEESTQKGCRGWGKEGEGEEERRRKGEVGVDAWFAELQAARAPSAALVGSDSGRVAGSKLALLAGLATRGGHV